MAYQYPLNGGRINASVSGNSTSAGAGYQLVSTGTLVLAGGNNVTLNQDANSISISGLNYANSNGVTFGINAGTLTASVNAAQSVQTIGGYASGNTTGQSSSTTFDARSMSISAMGGASAGFSGGMLQVSAPAMSSLSQTGIISLSQNGNTISIGAPAFSAGMSALGNTAGTSGTVSNQIIFAGGNNVTLSQSTGAGGNTITISGANIPAQTAYSFANGNGVSFGTNGSTVTATVATNYAASNHSHGNPTLNLTNITGTTASASNGMTLSLSAAAQTVQTQSNIQGIIASGSTNQTGNISFANANGVTFGLSNNTVTASFSGGGGGGGGIALANSQTTYTSGTANLIGSGAISINSTTGQSYIISAPVVSSLSETGIVSISRNGNTISIGASQSIQTQGLQTINLGGNTAGAMASISSGALSLYGGNNITLSQNANSVTISGGAGGGGGGGVALSAAGGSITSGTASIAAAGALGASVNGQTLNLSAPATSMLSAGDGISISTTGSTVVFQAVPTTGGGAAAKTWNYFNPHDAYPLAAGQHGQGTLHIQPFQAPNVQFDRIVLPMVHSNATNSSGSQTVSFWVGFYTRTDATLSLASSTSASFAVTQSGTVGSYSQFGGQRLFTIGSTNTLLEDQYYVGILSRTTSAGANANFSQLVASQINSNFSGIFGAASNATLQQTRGLGHFSASTSAMPSSVAISHIRGTASMALRQPAIYLVSQTF